MAQLDTLRAAQLSIRKLGLDQVVQRALDCAEFRRGPAVTARGRGVDRVVDIVDGPRVVIAVIVAVIGVDLVSDLLGNVQGVFVDVLAAAVGRCGRRAPVHISRCRDRQKRSGAEEVCSESGMHD